MAASLIYLGFLRQRRFLLAAGVGAVGARRDDHQCPGFHDRRRRVRLHLLRIRSPIIGASTTLYRKGAIVAWLSDGARCSGPFLVAQLTRDRRRCSHRSKSMRRAPCFRISPTPWGMAHGGASYGERPVRQGSHVRGVCSSEDRERFRAASKSSTRRSSVHCRPGLLTTDTPPASFGTRTRLLLTILAAADSTIVIRVSIARAGGTVVEGPTGKRTCATRTTAADSKFPTRDRTRLGFASDLRSRLWRRVRMDRLRWSCFRTSLTSCASKKRSRGPSA